MIDAAALAEALGVELKTLQDEIAAVEDPVMTVTFFKHEDDVPGHSLVTKTGDRIPLGVPVEELRKQLEKTQGAMVGPTGRTSQLVIPDDISDGEGYYASITYEVRTRRLGVRCPGQASTSCRRLPR